MSSSTEASHALQTKLVIVVLLVVPVALFSIVRQTPKLRSHRYGSASNLRKNINNAASS